MLQNAIEYANYVYSNVEFYSIGRSRKTHKGISFQMSDYFIDTDEACEFESRWDKILRYIMILHIMK